MLSLEAASASVQALIDRAHALDMRVVLDGVFNHCGRGFWAFHHVAENGADSPYRGTLVRFCIGLEDIDDLIADAELALSVLAR